jgi:hypothetical protein
VNDQREAEIARSWEKGRHARETGIQVFDIFDLNK